MKRYALLLIAALALWPEAVHAQTQAITNNLTVSVDGDTLDNGQNVFIGLAECKDDVEFKFSASSYTVKVPVLEVWVGQGSNAACATAASRKDSPNQESTCWRVASKDNVQASTTVDITVDATALFSREGKKCEEVTNQIYQVYLVPLESATQLGTGNAVEPISGAQSLSAKFTLYTKRPEPPTDVTGESGEETLGVDWDDSSSEDAFTTYRVYYDTAQDGTGDVECGSGALVAEEAAPDGDTISSKKASSGGTSISASGVEIGENIAVGVVTVDAAGNESVLSEVICVERVATDGFYDRYKAEGGDGLEECSAHAPGRVGISGWSSLTLIALGLLWRRRRIA